MYAIRADMMSMIMRMFYFSLLSYYISTSSLYFIYSAVPLEVMLENGFLPIESSETHFSLSLILIYKAYFLFSYLVFASNA